MKENLLPHFWKKIALSIFVLAIATRLINTTNRDLLNIETPILSWILKMLIIASLLIFVLTKEKTETKKIAQLRLDNILVSVITGVLFLILDTFMELAFAEGNYDMTSGYEIMMVVLLVYSIRFYIKKNIKTVVRG